MAATMRTPHAAPRFIYAPATLLVPWARSAHGRVLSRSRGVSRSSHPPRPWTAPLATTVRDGSPGNPRLARDPPRRATRPRVPPLPSDYLLRTARMTAAPRGAAVTPPSGVFSTMTATATVGASAGANPMNQPWGAEPGTFSAGPGFSATGTFGIFAPQAEGPGAPAAPTGHPGGPRGGG